MSKRETVTFDTPGTYRWTWPDNVASVDLEVKGADSGDGTPGETTRATLTMKPGGIYDITIGEGGSVIAWGYADGVGFSTFTNAGGGGGAGGACVATGGPVDVRPGTGGGGGSRVIPGHGRITISYDAPAPPGAS